MSCPQCPTPAETCDPNCTMPNCICSKNLPPIPVTAIHGEMRICLFQRGQPTTMIECCEPAELKVQIDFSGTPGHWANLLCGCWQIRVCADSCDPSIPHPPNLVGTMPLEPCSKTCSQYTFQIPRCHFSCGTVAEIYELNVTAYAMDCCGNITPWVVACRVDNLVVTPCLPGHTPCP